MRICAIGLALAALAGCNGNSGTTPDGAAPSDLGMGTPDLAAAPAEVNGTRLLPTTGLQVFDVTVDNQIV
jgi:hypothetical protein